MSSLLVCVSNLLVIKAACTPFELFLSEHEVYEKIYVAGLVNTYLLGQGQLHATTS